MDGGALEAKLGQPRLGSPGVIQRLSSLVIFYPPRVSEILVIIGKCPWHKKHTFHIRSFKKCGDHVPAVSEIGAAEEGGISDEESLCPAGWGVGGCG